MFSPTTTFNIDKLKTKPIIELPAMQEESKYNSAIPESSSVEKEDLERLSNSILIIAQKMSGKQKEIDANVIKYILKKTCNELIDKNVSLETPASNQQSKEQPIPSDFETTRIMNNFGEVEDLQSYDSDD